MSNSPFEIFRRNLKPLMVLLTGLALFAFVVLPVVDSYMRQNSASGGNAVVAKFGGKAITQSRVEYFTRNHNETVNFLKKLADATIARGGVPRTAGFQYDPQTKQVMRLGINQNPSYEGSVRTMMFADAAKDAGFELDDNAIQSWLDRFTDGMVSDNDIAALLMSSTQNRMAPPHLYEQLRSHLLADVYLKRGYAGLYSGDNPSAGALLTPVEQWEAFVKLNRSATIDAYGVMVNDYLEKTEANPSQDLITATYDEGKNRDPNDQSPEPAFHRRYQASFEIIEGNLEKFLEEEIAKLTEEQLRAEYDKRVAGGAFQVPDEKLDGLLEGDESAAQPTDKSTNDESSDGGKTAGGSGEESETASDSKAEMTEAKSTPEESASDEAAAEKPVSDQPVDEEKSGTQEPSDEPVEQTREEQDPANGEPTADEPAESESAEESPSENDLGLQAAIRSVRLVALQEDDQKDGGAESADESGETPTENDSAAEAQPADKTSADAPAAEESKPSNDGETPEAEMKAESNNADADSTGEDQAGSADDRDNQRATEADGDEPMDATEEAPAAEPKVESFEDVRERLERELAFPAAQKRMNEAATNIYKAMQSYFTQRAIHESNVAVGQSDDPPARPDLKAMAEEAGFEFRTVESRDQITIADDPVAFSMDAQTPFGGRGPNFTMMMYGYSLGNEIFDPRELFTPLQTADFMSGKVFVSWKTDDRDAYTPTLAEAREEVIKYLRMQEAKVLAMAAAEELAEQAAEENGKPLADLVPDDRQDNLKTGLGPFKWLDTVGRGVAFGNVPELDSVGEAFMEAVFSAEIGEYRVAPNAPERVIYIVTPTDFEPSIDELRQRFREPSNRRTLTAIDAGISGVLGDFYESVDEQAGFENMMVSE